MISANNITLRIGKKALFEDVNIKFTEGNCYGLIGANGAGKSTFLKILSGQLEPTSGDIAITPGQRLSFLQQDHFKYDEFTVLDTVIMGNKRLYDIMKEKDAIYAKEDFSDEDGIRASELEGEFAEMDGWNAESDAAMLLNGLGIPTEDHYTTMRDLPGATKVKVLLAQALFGNPDILLLDEPTNHLDYEMVEWLEDYLRRFRGAIIMITHDRYFLDSVCNRIVEVDKGQTYSYDTNYSGFLELKAAREESERASERKRQSILRKEIEWMQRGARARSTKQKAHIQRYEALRDQKGPQTDARVELSSVSSRMGRTTIELHDISKAYGDIVCVKDFTYIFLKNDRIGFVGKNGCGKSTLMKIIAGFIEPDSGEVEIGQTIKIGYFGQEVDIDPELRVIDYVKEAAEFVRTADGLVSASAMLERFLFPPEQQYSPVGKLSGGEKRRLYLLRVLMSAPNVLILDEPTNDLDVETLAILEDYLDGYDGIVITVSHDRYFLDRIAKRIFAFEGAGKIVQYEGGYTDYMNKRPQPASGKTVSENASSTGASASGAQGNTASDGTDSKEARKKKSMETWGHEKKLKFTYKEQKEYETIEADIEKLENRLSEIDDEMVKNATNFGKLNELTKEKEDLEGQLMEKMERWEYLEDLAQKIANLT